MHRDPQPVKLFTIAPMYRYGAPGPRALPRALAGLGRGARHGRSVDRRGADPALRHAARPARRDALPPRAELDRLSRVPARVPRGAPRVARTRTRERLDDETRERRSTSARFACSTTTSRSRRRSATRSTRRRRSASRSAPPASSTSPRSARDLDATGVEYTLVPTLVRGLDYYTRTTFEFVGPLENQNSTITGGGRYDYLIEEIGGPPTPGIGFGAGIERLLIAMEEEGVPDAAAAARSTCSSRSTRARRASDHRTLARRAPPGGRLGGDRLRRPLAQGPAHAGATARRGGDRRRRAGDGDAPRVRERRRAARPRRDRL